MNEATYQKKLKELQSYVPFLEDVIRQLEAQESNSREAQLTKIKQLHGLLTKKDKTLSPETIIKCEAVLKKMHKKLRNVTQPKSDLEISLAKLKSVPKTEKPRLPVSKPIINTPKSPQRNMPDIIRTVPLIIPTERKDTSSHYKDHDYRQDNLYQRRSYKSIKDTILVKEEYPKPSSSGSYKKNNVADVLKKPPLSADDITNLLHETTDEEDNLDSKDISELNKIRNSIVHKMKSEADPHGLVDNDYTGHNRLAYKYPRKKVERNKSISSETESIEPPLPPAKSVYANINTTPIPLNFPIENPYMKQEWQPPIQKQPITPTYNIPSLAVNDPRLAVNTDPRLAVGDPRLRQQQQQIKPQPLLNNYDNNNSGNYYNNYIWYQNNMQHGQMVPHQQQQQQQHQQNSYFMQHQQQMTWAQPSQPRMQNYTDQKTHQTYNNSNISYGNRFNNDRQHTQNFNERPNSSYDESYKKFRPTLNDMVERKFYEKSKKSQHSNNVAISLTEPPKFEIVNQTHDLTSDDWIEEELNKNLETKNSEKVKNVKELQETPKVTTLIAAPRDINKPKDDVVIELQASKNHKNEKSTVENDVVVQNKETPVPPICDTEKSTSVSNANKTTGELKINGVSNSEDITKEWLESFLINLFKPNKTADEASSNVLGLLSKVIDEKKYQQIKNILENDDSEANSKQTEKVISKENESIDSAEKSASLEKSPTSPIDTTGNEEKNHSEHEDACDNFEVASNSSQSNEPRKFRTRRHNELEKLNEDIRNMFICKGVLTSTGRRMCTILKDNAYTEPSDKLKRTSSQNNASKKSDGGVEDVVKTTRRTALAKNCSVVVPKLNLNSDNNKIIDSNVQNNKVGSNNKSSGDPVKSIGLRKKKRKRQKSQWASGVIIKKNQKRKLTDDDLLDNESEIKTEVEDNIPDDVSNISDFSEVAVTPAPKIIKNTNINNYFGNKACNKCVVCEKTFGINRMTKHYVVEHSDCEVFISRLSPEVACIFLNNLGARCGARTFHKSRPVIKFSCYFCDSLCLLSVDDWISHIASHTGEYLRKCTKCSWQSAFGYIHQCPKKGTAIVINEFKFDGNNFYGYLCSGCNYVQLNKEGVEKHIQNEHDSHEKDIKILQINLVNVPAIQLTKKPGRKKLQPATVAISEEESPSTAFLSSSDNDSHKNFHAKEKEIIGEMEIRKTSSSSIVDRLKARFKTRDNSTRAEILNTVKTEKSLEIDVVNENSERSQETNESPVVEPGSSRVANLEATTDNEPDNKSNDSEWEDFDDINSNESSTSISKLQKQIETSSNNGKSDASLTNTLVRLFDIVNPKRKSAEEDDASKQKKQRIDFREILKQSQSLEEVDSGSMANESNKIIANEEPTEAIKIKQEIDDTIKIKIEPQTEENENNENSELFRIERMGYKKKEKTFPQAFRFVCLFEGCGYSTTNSTEFTEHINAKENEIWEGFCYICESYVRADENMPLTLELKHMFEVHLKMNICINVEELVKPPTLSLRKLPGDLLSSSLQNLIRTVSNEHISDMLLIKPWTRYQNQKTHVNCEEMLKENKLTNLFKCMGMNCQFSTANVIDYLDHLKNHEQLVEDQLVTNQCNVDTSSWLECPYCEIFADTYFDLVEHVTKKHKNSLYQCGYCFYRSFLATNVVMHRKKHHNDLPLSVLLCDKMQNLPKINFEKILISRATNIRPLHCNVESCHQKKFYALDRFINHYTEHNQEYYTCEFCSLSINAKTILSHLINHGIGLFECIYCRFASNKIDQIQMHMCDAHPTKLLFITFRIFRPPEPPTLADDFAANISSIYLVNFGQRLTINLSQLYVTGNNQSLDLLENERPKVFPPTFDGGCLLNIAECNKLIAGSSAYILNLNKYGTSVVPFKPMFSSPKSGMLTSDITSEKTETAPFGIVKNTPLITKPKSPIRVISISSASSLLKSIPSIEELAKITSTTRIVKPTTVVSNETEINKETTRPAIDDPATMHAVAVSTTKPTNDVSQSESSTRGSVLTAQTPIEPSTSNTFKTPSSTIIRSNNLPTPPVSIEMPPPPAPVTTEKQTGAKEISEEQLATIAKEISQGSISSKNTKFQCLLPTCNTIKPSYYTLNLHLLEHEGKTGKPFLCYVCSKEFSNAQSVVSHLSVHPYRFFCYYCSFRSPLYGLTVRHIAEVHKISGVISKPITKTAVTACKEVFVIAPRNITDENFQQYKYELMENHRRENRKQQHFYDPEDVNDLPREAIFFNEKFCSVCKYGTKVRKNMERHLQFHLNEVPVAKNDPINPVPCLSTTERHFDKMKNLACSSQEDRDRLKLIDNAPKYITETQRFTCGASNCQYFSIDESMLNCHLKTLHSNESAFKCVHCKTVPIFDCPDIYVHHLRLHDSRLFKCNMCDFYDSQRAKIEKHCSESHKPNLATMIVIREEATASTSVNSNVVSNSDVSNVSSNSNGSVTWSCNSCSFVTPTRKLVIDHNMQVHSYKSQFMCRICGYRNNIRPNVEAHIARKHSDARENQVFTTFSRSDEPESTVFVDNSPLWRRDANRVKNIRGILCEDEENPTTNSPPDRENRSDTETSEAEGVYCCTYCNYSSSFYRNFKMHHNEKHKDFEFKFKHMPMRLTTRKEKPQSNDKTVASSTLFLCAYCAKRHHSIKNILEHWKDKHQNPKIRSDSHQVKPLPFQFRLTQVVRCYYCNDKYGYHELARHVAKRHPNLSMVTRHPFKTKRCGECNFKWETSEVDLVHHSKSEHSNSKYRSIPDELLSENNLSTYINMEMDQFYFCTICNMESNEKSELEAHFRTVHKNEKNIKIELKNNKLLYHCNSCKFSSSDEFVVIKHVMKYHSHHSGDKSPSRLLHNAIKFQNNIDKFDQIRLMFPNGLVLNKADVVNTSYGGYDHIIKYLKHIDDKPSPLSKKRRIFDEPSTSSSLDKEISKFHPSEIKRIRLNDDRRSVDTNQTPNKSYDLSKIFTTMVTGGIPVRVSCDRFAASVDLNPVVKLNRI